MDSFQTLKKTKANVLLQVWEELSNGCTQLEDIDIFSCLLSYKLRIYADEHFLT